MYPAYAALLVPLAAVMALPTARPLLQCDHEIVGNIWTYRFNAPSEQKVTLSQLNYASGRMRLIAGTNSSENSPYKCRILNFYPYAIRHRLGAEMEFENDGVKETMKVKEEGYKLILPDFAVIYNIIINRGVYAAYKCREAAKDGVVPAPPLPLPVPVGEDGSAVPPGTQEPEAWVAAVDEANQTDINNALGVMELIGLSLDHEFNCSDVLSVQEDIKSAQTDAL